MKTILKFIQPIKYNKKLYFKGFCQAIVWAVNPIIHILFIEELVFLVEESNIQGFKNIVIMYVIYGLIYEILIYIVRKWGWAEDIEGFKKVMGKIYLEKFFRLDKDRINKIGIDKFEKIMKKGINTWGILLTKVLEETISIIIMVICTFYLIFIVNIGYSFIFIFVYLIINIIWKYINQKISIYGEKKKCYKENYEKKFRKLLELKLDRNKIGKQTQKINTLNKDLNKIISYNKKIAEYQNIFFRIPKGFMSWGKIIIMAIVGYSIINGNGDISLLVAIFGIMTIMETLIDKSIIFNKEFYRQQKHVFRLWNLFNNKNLGNK